MANFREYIPHLLASLPCRNCASSACIQCSLDFLQVQGDKSDEVITYTAISILITCGCFLLAVWYSHRIYTTITRMHDFATEVSTFLHMRRRRQTLGLKRSGFTCTCHWKNRRLAFCAKGTQQAVSLHRSAQETHSNLLCHMTVFNQ